MTFKELFVLFLSEDPVLAGIVGPRIYDTYLPEGDPAAIYPCLTYQVVSRQHVKNLQGNGGTYYPRIELTAWSLKSADVEAIVERIFALEGALTLNDGNKTKFRWLWVEDGQDDAEATQQNDERAVRSGAVDLVLWYDG